MNKKNAVATSGNYYAIKEIGGYTLWFGCKIDGKFESVFVSDFFDIDDFDYEVDKAKEEVAYMMRDVVA